jgi:hypothetical protein
VVACYSDSNAVGGETLWTYSYDSPDGLRDLAACVAVGDTGQVYVAGECQRVGQWDWSSLFVARFDLAGWIQEPFGTTSVRGVEFVPNPCLGIGRLCLPCPVTRAVRLYDRSGREVGLGPIPMGIEGTLLLDLRHLACGVYWLVAPTRESSVALKIVLE